MTLLLLVLAAWLLLSVVTATLFSTLVRSDESDVTEPARPRDVVLPQPRADQDVRSTAMSGGRG